MAFALLGPARDYRSAWTGLRGKGHGAGDDAVAGKEGDDTLLRDNGADTVNGGIDDDTLHGGDGSDTLIGGMGDDSLSGEAGNDTLLGQYGDDDLFGGSDQDNLYGGYDDDFLNGGSGRDGLLPGLDGTAEEAYGGDGPDRFLLPAPEHHVYNNYSFTTWEDEAADLATEDARVWLNEGGETWQWDVQYAAGNWSESKLQMLDEALAVLHHATGNDNLLEEEDGSSLNITILGEVIDTRGSDFFEASGWNGGGEITLTGEAFVSESWAIQTVIHEIGHNWDDEYDEEGWEELSGWVSPRFSLPIVSPEFVRSLDGEWYYSVSATFNRQYATTNPREDFACAFQNYFINMTPYTYSTGGAPYKDISLIPGKLAFLEDMVADLS